MTRRVIRRRKGVAVAVLIGLSASGYGAAEVVARVLSPEVGPLRTKFAAQRAPFDAEGVNGWRMSAEPVLLQPASLTTIEETGDEPQVLMANLAPTPLGVNLFERETPTLALPEVSGALGRLNEEIDAVLTEGEEAADDAHIRQEIEAETPLLAALVDLGVSEEDAEDAADALPETLNPGDVVEINFAPAAFRFDLRDSGQTGQAAYRIGVFGADGARSRMQWSMISAFSYDDEIEVVRLSPAEAAAKLEAIREEDRRRAQELDGPVRIAGEINGSLYVSAQGAGLTLRQTNDLIAMFRSLIDFQRDIRRGDSFTVLFDRDWDENGSYEDGPIRYAALTNRGRTIELFRFQPADGSDGYYDAEGRTNKRSLLRTPIQGGRISSRYGMRRHPISGYNRMHKGVDFAAPTGTPIIAAGNGTVDFIGRRGGYGKYIRIRHTGQYSTAYAHLSRYARGLSRGDRVRQGEVIGYVGSTGRSTGPHLHYEVLKSGRQVNPMSVSGFDPVRLAGAELQRFNTLRESVGGVLAALENRADERRIVSAD